MIVQWLDYEEQLRRELEESVQGIWADESLLYWCNEAARDIASMTGCNTDIATFTTVSGTQSYPVPQDTISVNSALCTASDEASYTMIKVKLDFIIANSAFRNIPTRYYVDDQNIYLYPTPDDIYTISLMRSVRPDEVVETGSMPFSDKYNAAITFYIKSKAYEQILDFDTANVFFARYQNELEKILNNVAQSLNAKYHLSVESVY
jgi:hypothetical protein